MLKSNPPEPKTERITATKMSLYQFMTDQYPRQSDVILTPATKRRPMTK